MAIDFPTSPTPNQVHTSGSRSWSWNNSVGAWYAVNAGVQGVQGIQGAQGIQGVQGITGLAFTIAKTYLSVAALTADTSPTSIVAGQFALINTSNVENAENSRLYIWNGSSYIFVDDLSGSAGIQGITGSQGTVGAQGTIGTQGTQGIQGLQGITGTQGTAGNQGINGSQGAQGIQGLQGAQGTQGIQGITGSQGTQGTQGAQGLQGISGASILGLNNTFTGVNSININGTVGATTASTGAFTTLSASGLLSTAAGFQFRGADATAYELLRYTGGTNNPGIFVKVNEATRHVEITASGSSVAGQKLRLGAEGTIGVAEISSTGLAVTGALSATGIISQTPNAGDPSYKTELVTAYNGADSFRLKVAGATFLRVNTNDGVLLAPSGLAVTGALSASNTLDVGSTSTLHFTQLTNNDQSNCRLRFINTGSGGQTWDILGGTNGASNAGLGFLNGSTTYMQLSTTGLAVTGALSATGEIRSSTNLVAQSGGLFVGSGGYQLYLRTISGTNRIDSYNNPITAAVPLQLNASTFSFQISDVVKMTLDASGQLGIGTSSPAVKLHVQSGSAGATALRLTDAVRGTCNIDFPATSQVRWDVGAAEKTLFSSGGSTILTINDINSGGNVGIGTSSPAFPLDVRGSNPTFQVKDNGNVAYVKLIANGTYAFSALSYKNVFTFDDNGTERARIDSSGNLLVGTTTATGSISNTAPVVAGVFKTISGSVSAATSTYTTIATLGNITNATYIVSCGIAAGDPANYSAVSIVSQDGTTLRSTSLQTATLMTIRISGQDIQALQASGIGVPIPIYFTITRVS